jgi:hypothetical protein
LPSGVSAAKAAPWPAVSVAVTMWVARSMTETDDGTAQQAIA